MVARIDGHAVEEDLDRPNWLQQPLNFSCFQQLVSGSAIRVLMTTFFLAKMAQHWPFGMGFIDRLLMG